MSVMTDLLTRSVLARSKVGPRAKQCRECLETWDEFTEDDLPPVMVGEEECPYCNQQLLCDSESDE